MKNRINERNERIRRIPFRRRFRFRLRQFLCFHEWHVIEEVGEYWDLTLGLKILCGCNKCKKQKKVWTGLIDEVPDSKINKRIQYHY